MFIFHLVKKSAIVEIVVKFQKAAVTITDSNTSLLLFSHSMRERGV